jgi:hypothetical protein
MEYLTWREFQKELLKVSLKELLKASLIWKE